MLWRPICVLRQTENAIGAQLKITKLFSSALERTITRKLKQNTLKTNNTHLQKQWTIFDLQNALRRKKPH